VTVQCGQWPEVLMRSTVLLISLLAILADPASAQPAGRLIAADPVVETPAGMQAWRVRYLATDDRGRSSEVTGMVVAPREAVPRQARPVLAWTHEPGAPRSSARPR
jgi:hypothetical protein